VAEVAVLGVGRMGGAMARRLVAAGHRVSLWNRTQAAADALAQELGSPLVNVMAEAAQAVDGVQYVICSFANGDVSRSVLLDPAFLLALRPDAVVCDMGTTGVAVARSLNESLQQCGFSFVDAPVSGSVATATAGQLLVLASGEQSVVDALREVFAAFAKQVSYVGAAGSGQAMKLAVNLVVHDLNAALSEALVFATRSGIEAADAYAIFQESVVGSPFVNYKREAFLNPKTPVAMSLDLVMKDLGLITESADALGVDVPTTKAVTRAVVAACGAGFGPADMAALSRFLSQESPLTSN